MAKETWTLLDVARDVCLESIELGPRDLGSAAAGCRVLAKTLRGGLREGLHLLEIDNGVLRLALLPGRGMGIWKAWHGTEVIGWRSPVKGPVHPRYVAVAEPSGLGWLDGFDELLVRCGLSSFGAPEHDAQGRLLWPLHGRIANLPAHQVEVAMDKQTGEITVRGVVDESRFHFQKLRLTSSLSIRPGEATLRIHDTVENLSGNPADMQLLYHVNIGEPLLDADSTVVAPVAEVSPRDAVAAKGIDNWDRLGPPQAGSSESVYFLRLREHADGTTQVLLKNARGQRGISLRYRPEQMPCFTIWKNTPASVDGYVTGLEPGTSFPNVRSHEAAQDRLVKLGPGEKVTFELELAYHADAASVDARQHEIEQLSGTTQTHRQPKQGWTMAPGAKEA